MANPNQYGNLHGLKLNEALIQTLERCFRKGMGVKRSCGAAGISETCFRRWMKEGHPEHPKYKEHYGELRLRVEAAKAVCVETNLARIEKAAKMPNHWTAAAWLLERTNPDDFARRSQQKVQLEGEVENTIKLDLSSLSIDQMKQILATLESEEGAIIDGEVIEEEVGALEHLS